MNKELLLYYWKVWQEGSAMNIEPWSLSFYHVWSHLWFNTRKHLLHFGINMWLLRLYVPYGWTNWMLIRNKFKYVIYLSCLRFKLGCFFSLVSTAWHEPIWWKLINVYFNYGYYWCLECPNRDCVATLLSSASRANAKRPAEETARSWVSWDPSAGQLSGVLHPRYALPDGGDARCLWLLRAGRDELLWPGLCWRSWQVSMGISAFAQG